MRSGQPLRATESDVASVSTHLFFFFKYLPSTSTNRLVQRPLFSMSTRLFFAPVYACLRACSSACSTFSAHSSSIDLDVFRQRRTASPSSASGRTDPHGQHY